MNEPTLEEDPAYELPEQSTEIVTGPGDLWLLGKHRLLCGDARDESSFVRLMGDSRAGVVFSDPPYDVAIDGHVGGNGKIHHDEFAMASGEMNEAEFTELLSASLRQLASGARMDLFTSFVWIGATYRNY